MWDLLLDRFTTLDKISNSCISRGHGLPLSMRTIVEWLIYYTEWQIYMHMQLFSIYSIPDICDDKKQQQ